MSTSTPPDVSDPPSVFEAMSNVMAEVQAIGKSDRNDQQKFNFRGIDSVINAVGPAFRRHRIVVVPSVQDVQHENITTRSGAPMRNTTVIVQFRFYGPRGDSIDAVTIGEAADSGDKSVPKAQSVAFRVALLQALCIPTNEPDPDSQTVERAAPRAASGRDWANEVKLLQSVEAVSSLWRECSAFGELTDDLRTAMTARAAEIEKAAETAAAEHNEARETVGASR